MVTGCSFAPKFFISSSLSKPYSCGGTHHSHSPPTDPGEDGEEGEGDGGLDGVLRVGVRHALGVAPRVGQEAERHEKQKRPEACRCEDEYHEHDQCQSPEPVRLVCD